MFFQSLSTYGKFAKMQSSFSNWPSSKDCFCVKILAPNFLAFFSATRSALGLISDKTTCQLSGNSSAAVIPKHPEPVPISMSVLGWSSCGASFSSRLIISSDSGRGTSTLGDTLKFRP